MLAREAAIRELNKSANFQCRFCRASGHYEPHFGMAAMLTQEQLADGKLVVETSYYTFECGSSWRQGSWTQTSTCAQAAFAAAKDAHHLAQHETFTKGGHAIDGVWGWRGQTTCSCGFVMDWSFDRDHLHGYNARDAFELHQHRPELSSEQLISFWHGMRFAEHRLYQAAHQTFVDLDESIPPGVYERTPEQYAERDGMVKTYYAVRGARISREGLVTSRGGAEPAANASSVA